MSEFQPKLVYENLNDALHDLVQALGGYKKLAPVLWPEKPMDDAAQLLRHCLNPDRREKLSPEQLQLLLRMGRECNFHRAIEYLVEALGYERPKPVDPKNEEARLAALIDTSTRTLATAIERLEVLRGGSALRAVK